MEPSTTRTPGEEGVELYVVDAFTPEAFRGNPAAVCVLDAGDHPDDAWMQSVAAEMKHSETAFLVPRGDAWSLRWFTPIVEVELCGHATLASAHVLFETGAADATATITFVTRWRGDLRARRAADTIELDFPASPASPASTLAGLAEGLRTQPRHVAVNDDFVIAELADEHAVRDLDPVLEALRALGPRGVIVTAAAGAGTAADFVSRYWAPGAGIADDPVTGSAHCALAPYWAAKLGRTELVGLQVSSRPGTVRMRLDRDRVFLGGDAVTVLRGMLLPRHRNSIGPSGGPPWR
ncbi:MAG: PhzF family phenazine biosynthesis protein [Acidimicrobiia bacterium]